MPFIKQSKPFLRKVAKQIEKEFVVYQSKWRQVRNTGLGLIACFIGAIFVCRLFNMYAFIPEIFLIFYLSIFFRQIKNKKIVLLNTQGIYYYNTSFNNHSLFIPWNKIKKIISVGLPTALGSSAMQFGFVLMSKNVYVFGSSAMAAYGVGNKINGIITLPANALGSATSTIVGQNLGAGQIKRAEKGYKTATIVGMGLLFIMGMILSRPAVSTIIVNIFTSDNTVVPMAVDFISIMSFWCFTNSVYNCTVGLLNGSGKTKITMIIEATRLWVFRFATIFFCQNILHMGVESIWYSVVVSNGLSALILLIVYTTRIWEKDSLGVRSASPAKHN